MYVQINIGRNVGTEPMSNDRWNDFINDAIMFLTHSANGDKIEANGVIELHMGIGHWGGIPEDSAHISLYWEDGVDIDALKNYLLLLKRSYNQDSIALIVGSELV